MAVQAADKALAGYMQTRRQYERDLRGDPHPHNRVDGDPRGHEEGEPSPRQDGEYPARVDAGAIPLAARLLVDARHDRARADVQRGQHDEGGQMQTLPEEGAEHGAEGQATRGGQLEEAHLPPALERAIVGALGQEAQRRRDGQGGAQALDEARGAHQDQHEREWGMRRAQGAQRDQQHGQGRERRPSQQERFTSTRVAERAGQWRDEQLRHVDERREDADQEARDPDATVVQIDEITADDEQARAGRDPQEQLAPDGGAKPPGAGFNQSHRFSGFSPHGPSPRARGSISSAPTRIVQMSS